MKKLCTTLFGVFLVACLASFQTIKSQTIKTQEASAFTEFLSQFTDSTAYAVVTIDGQQVLLVSNGVFNNSGDSTNVELAALYAQVYKLDGRGKIIPLGEVHSQSTGTPVAMAQDGLMTCGHRFVNRYNLSKDGKSLEISECITVEFGKDDSVKSFYEDRTKDVYRDCDGEKDMNMMFGKYDAAKPVIFNYK